MSPTRRDFIKATTSTAAALAVGDHLTSLSAEARSANAAAQSLPAPAADAAVLDLANEALNAARGAGASYADVRIGRYRRQGVATRERQVLGVSDNESYGLGVRTLVDGSWGFAATSRMTRSGAQQAALAAVEMSKAARAVRRRRVELAPTRPVTGTWMTPVRTDPIEIPVEEKIALLLATNEAALKVPGVQFASSSVSARSPGLSG